MQVLLDRNNFFLGNYSNSGTFNGGVSVSSIPNTGNHLKDLSYKLVNCEWVYDSEKYAELVLNHDLEQVGLQEESVIDIDEAVTEVRNTCFDLLLELA